MPNDPVLAGDWSLDGDATVRGDGTNMGQRAERKRYCLSSNGKKEKGTSKKVKYDEPCSVGSGIRLAEWLALQIDSFSTVAETLSPFVPAVSARLFLADSW